MDERLERVVQLAATHEHGSDLGQLAGIARKTIGLGVERDELGAHQRPIEDVHLRLDTRPSGRRGRPLARQSFIDTGDRADS